MSAHFPSLPQKASPSEQQQRRVELDRQRQVYAYDFNSALKPLGITKQLAAQDKPPFAWYDGLVTTALDLLGNYLSIAAKRFDKGKVLPDANDSGLSEWELRLVEDTYKKLTDSVRRISEFTARLHQASRTPTTGLDVGVDIAPQPSLLHRAGHLMDRVADELKGAVVDELKGAVAGAVVGAVTGAVAVTMDASVVVSIHEDVESLSDALRALIHEPVMLLLTEEGERFLRFVGLFGRATSMENYRAPFSRLLLNPVASNCDTDIIFARMRLAGPNPLVIRRVHAPDSRFPVTDAHLRARTGPTDSLSRAGEEGRLYLADYAVFEGLKTGQTSGEQKYIEAPLALFVVPPKGATDRRLLPVAIQLSQRAGAPIFTPEDGTSWRLACLHVQVADGNYLQLISHLGLTHLVLEQFAIATPRQLPVQHPLYLLLTPHFQGTLSINMGAANTLMAQGGPVDKLLAGEINASLQVCTQAVRQHHIKQAFLPKALELRGVEDREKLPDYPYRDDALLLWNDIRVWVNDYLSLYYHDDAAIRDDHELQAWIRELGSPDGGQLREIEEASGGIQTRTYLVDLVTYILFTASAQHAAVNFPQRTIMSFIPAMPLAAYAPGPTSIDPSLPESAQLRHLPPVQMGVLQQVVGFGLGNVYFIRLGNYDAHLRGPWFTDPRVGPLQKAFQDRLWATEQEIGRRNLSRIPYETLLPSAIPQSINI